MEVQTLSDRATPPPPTRPGVVNQQLLWGHRVGVKRGS